MRNRQRERERKGKRERERNERGSAAEGMYQVGDGEGKEEDEEKGGWRTWREGKGGKNEGGREDAQGRSSVHSLIQQPTGIFNVAKTKHSELSLPPPPRTQQGISRRARGSESVFWPFDSDARCR